MTDDDRLFNARALMAVAFIFAAVMSVFLIFTEYRMSRELELRRAYLERAFYQCNRAAMVETPPCQEVVRYWNRFEERKP